MNKISVMYNQLISYKVYTLTNRSYNNTFIGLCKPINETEY